MTDAAPGFDESQRHFFNTFGYALLPGLLTAAELQIVEREHREGLAAAFPDEPFDGSIGQWTRMANERTPFFAALPEDPRFLTPAQQQLGADVLGNGTDAHFSVGDTEWHSDSGWQPESLDVQAGIKYHFHLDVATATTGALRFMPGSHLLRGSQRQAFAAAIAKVPAAAVPGQSVPTQPGDVVVFDIRTWHASQGGRPGRRPCNVEYFRNPDSPQGIELLRELGRLEANSRNAHKYTYPRNWLDNPQNSPVRRRWIERYLEIGFLDQPGVGEL